MIKSQAHWLSMLARFIFLLFLYVGNIFANQTQDVEVLAQNVTKNGTLVHAIGSVVLYSPKYLITSDEAYYDYESGDLELIGNITILEGITYSSRSGHTKLNLKTDKGNSSPLFFFDEESNVWIQCENAVLNPETYITQKSIVSSCNVQEPDWKIAFTTGEFNKEQKWLHLYNPIFYANDIPVFYLPYFSFSTDTTRRTGFLRPDIGFGGEGLFYLQPIYFAPAENWDLEVSPQIRTDRGEGIHSSFRFFDSPYSHGEIKGGFFNEHQDYAQAKNLKNDKHYGYKIMYDRSALLSTKYDNLEDGLWLDFNYLNDVDYYNTINNETQTYDKLTTSRLNYYAKRDLDYFGLYAKYYIDTSKISNADTLQELPTLQYHRFSSPLLFDNLLYSVDYSAKNYSRSEGVTAVQNEFSAPFSLYFSMLEDYLHVGVSENIYMSHVSYNNELGTEDNGQYLRNYHKFSLFSELTKPYDNFLHTMYLGVDHIVPSTQSKDGYWIDFVPLDTLEKSTTFSLKEFFYSQEGDKKISHKLKQAKYYSDYKYKYGDLENDIKYHVSENLSLGNTLHYSHEFDKFSRNQISLNYQDSIYAGSLRYTFEDSTYEDAIQNKDYSYLTLSASTKYFPHYKLFTSVDYDLKDEIFKSWNIGFQKSQKCWDYSLIYRDVNTPRLTSTSIDSVNRKGFLLRFNIYPFGTIGHEFVTAEGVKTIGQ